jgi:hypothetical protein
MSVNNRLQASLALNATQAGPDEGLNCLRVAATAHGNRAPLEPLEEGELFVPAGGASSSSSRGGAFYTQLSQFLLGGLGLLGTDGDGRGSGECTILALEHFVGGSFQILQG